jgi:ribosomal protein L37E
MKEAGLRCPNCGAQAGATDEFCENCGFSFPKKERKWGWGSSPTASLATFLVVAALAGTLGTCILLNALTSPPAPNDPGLKNAFIFFGVFLLLFVATGFIIYLKSRSKL